MAETEEMAAMGAPAVMAGTVAMAGMFDVMWLAQPHRLHL